MSIYNFEKQTMLHLLVQTVDGGAGYRILESIDTKTYPSLEILITQSPICVGYELAGYLIYKKVYES